ncbi:fumarylacetoacetate hydrolase [Limnohabitans sp. T6-5]|uniref:fumarylacetoacetate hydrolase family protein n=1 Tax=Limnohabitans sp. T6-5 TaxID=1100724 RepID=UPI000D340A2A|nr:fumarylacetoacetate hydrolase family protein [Limnohabitans sp. T6-5]PUE09481.1 fumarylacetoacetate hydrolase [Limnohabitans sp. T6-5]
MNKPCRWQPAGTVYGTLLNFQREWNVWAPRMTQDPHKAPPKAPVLYIKTANTFNPSDALELQDDITEVDVGATVGLVMGPDGQPESAVLINDWSVPHDSYYRPPSKFRCRDGYMGLGQPVPWSQISMDGLSLSVRVNGVEVQEVQLGTLVRSVEQLLADVCEFMTLQPGDVLMVGTDCLDDGTRPRARAGDCVEIAAPGFTTVLIHVKGQA